MIRFFQRRCGKRSSPKVSGQVMILTTLVIGGTILGATTIGGLLVLYQIRQSTDLANSAKAVFAADTGVEWGLYEYYKKRPPAPSPHPRPATPLSNGASFTTICRDSAGSTVSCNDPQTDVIIGTGDSGNVKRAFKISF